MSKKCMKIDTEYADDVGKIVLSKNSDEGKIITSLHKTHLQAYFSDRNLQCNPDKPGEYTITRHGKILNI